jgi:methylthioribose-1-phosphate isomerase
MSRDAMRRAASSRPGLPDGTGARNPAFDVTPAALVTGLITERGVCEASPEALAALFPDRVNKV